MCEDLQSPSAKIDSAICDLIAAISHCSDDFFDSGWLEIQAIELELIVVELIEEVRQNLTGQQLVFYILQIRQCNVESS